MSSRLTEADRYEIARLLSAGMSQVSVAALFNTHQPIVSLIAKSFRERGLLAPSVGTQKGRSPKGSPPKESAPLRASVPQAPAPCTLAAARSAMVVASAPSSASASGDEDAPCRVCNDPDCDEDNPIMFCEMCGLAVHVVRI